jgi:hypothetical protein
MGKVTRVSLRGLPLHTAVSRWLIKFLKFVKKLVTTGQGLLSSFFLGID